MRKPSEARNLLKEIEAVVQEVPCQHCQLVLSGMAVALGWVIEYAQYSQIMQTVIDRTRDHGDTHGN